MNTERSGNHPSPHADLDRRLIADVVDREMHRHPRMRASQSELSRVTGMSRATLNRLQTPGEWDRISQRSYRRIEVALDLPFEALTMIGEHDLETLRSAGAAKDLTDWVARRISSSNGSVSASS